MLISAFIFCLAFILKIDARTNVRVFDGFQNLDAALIPAGTFITLKDIGLSSNPTPSATTTSPNVDSDEQLIKDLLLLIPEIQNEEIMMSPPEKRLNAGIKPITTIALPVGLFIPFDRPAVLSKMKDESVKNWVKTKLRYGIRKVIRKLKLIIREKNKKAFDYSRTFNGLTPLEAVYIPPGYFVPFAAVSDVLGNNSGNGTISGVTIPTYFSGLSPLTARQLPGGVFVPKAMGDLPDLPNILNGIYQYLFLLL